MNRVESNYRFGALLDQERPVFILRSFLESKRIPHALLFTGPDGVGKRTAATVFSMALNCGEPNADSGIEPCGACRSCRLIRKDQHPDMHVLGSEGNGIRVAQVRELLSAISLKPMEARFRVIRIPDAQKLNLESGNALLKVIEEPPARTIFILSAPAAGDVLPTLTSRSQQIRFHPLSDTSVARLLSVITGVAPDPLSLPASLSGGSMRRALRLMDPEWQTLRNWLVPVLTGPDRNDPLRMLTVADRLAGDQARLSDALEIIESIYRDALVVLSRHTGIYNRDHGDAIAAMAAAVPSAIWLQRIEAVRSARKALESNAAMRLALEVMLLRCTSEESYEESSRGPV